MSKNTSKFSNNIKKYDLIRNAIREIYMYGYYSKDDIVSHKLVKSKRSSYDLLKRITNYLGEEYLQIHRLPGRKKGKDGYRLKYDPFQCPINYLAHTYLNCSYVIEDFIFYFAFLQAFKSFDEEKEYPDIILDLGDDFSKETSDLTVNSTFTDDELIENIIDIIEYNEKAIIKLKKSVSTSKINTSKLFTTAKFKSRLQDLKDLGIIEKAPTDLSNNYKLTDDILEKCSEIELSSLQLMTQFFYNCSFFTVPGYFFSITLEQYINITMAKTPPAFHNYQTNPVFLYKNNSLQNVLDDNILWTTLCAIHQLLPIIYDYKNEQNITFPIKIIIDREYSRYYFWGYNYAKQNYIFQRLDSITNLKILDKYPDKLSFLSNKCRNVHQELNNIYNKNMENVWNITTGNTITNVLIHFNFSKEDFKKGYDRVNSTGHDAAITQTSAYSFDFSIDVQNEREMVPWIRSFGSTAIVDAKNNPELFNLMKKDIEETLKTYGII